MRNMLCVLATLPTIGWAEADPVMVSALDRCLNGERQEASAHVCIGRQSEQCMEKPGGYSTAGMAGCTYGEADAWDVLLNRYYQKARHLARALDSHSEKNFPEYAVRAQTLLEAQRAWITFRDANCAAEYAQAGSGTIRQLYGASCHLYTTADRTIWLFNYAESVL